MRGTLEQGNIVDANWQSRVEDGLGTYSLELSKSYAAVFMQDPLKLGALQSACALVDAALPEREVHAGLYHGLATLFEMLEGDVWGAAYVMWEIAFLKELGFSLDLTSCAGGGDGALVYVSPKTGRAVSQVAGAPYKGKLLDLPSFLRPSPSPSHASRGVLPLPEGEGNEACDPGLDPGELAAVGEGMEEEVYKGLQMTGHFLEHWVFNHHTKGVPDARVMFAERFGKSF